MILPIYVYGQPVLRKVAEDITPDYPGLKELIANMFETMDHAEGVGLAAPQIGLPIRVVVLWHIQESLLLYRHSPEIPVLWVEVLFYSQLYKYVLP